MAPHHGGQRSPPRAHRPRAPIMSLPVPLTAPLAPLRPPVAAAAAVSPSSSSSSTAAATSPSTPGPVSLAAPRPENERAANEYVETPFRATSLAAPACPSTPPGRPRQHHHQRGRQQAARPQRLPLPLPASQHNLHHHQQQQQQHPVTKQPTSFVGKDAAASLAAECSANSSIMCPDCGRCRCDPCQLPRPLPSRWVCGKTCLLSADAVIDYATCLCCVKGLFYHCSEGDGGVSCADDPCGCGPDRRAARWGCLAALSCALPCLWCYWPLQGCKRAVEACYARHSRQGCRCRPQQIASSTATTTTTPEKRLLDSSPDF